jgi:hypothetical protein
MTRFEKGVIEVIAQNSRFTYDEILLTDFSGKIYFFLHGRPACKRAPQKVQKSKYNTVDQ